MNKKNLISIIFFLIAFMAVFIPVSPFVSLNAEANAGLPECKDRCSAKWAQCAREHGSKCSEAFMECTKDCEANYKK